MNRAGILVMGVLFGTAVGFLLLNVQSSSPPAASPPWQPTAANPPVQSPSDEGAVVVEKTGTPLSPRPFREYPVGDESQVRNHMEIVAAWLPPVAMEGMELPSGEDIIHLEADIHATAANPNGFAAGEWMPYLTVIYTLTHIESGRVISERMMPMVAGDGPHYAATIRMPSHGRYRLKYEIRPPSENGFGRHNDPVTGVAPWWEPFTVEWDFEYQGVPAGDSQPAQ